MGENTMPWCQLGGAKNPTAVTGLRSARLLAVSEELSCSTRRAPLGLLGGGLSQQNLQKHRHRPSEPLPGQREGNADE